MNRGGLHWSRSLRFRLLAVTVAGLTVAVVLAGLVLSGLFREHVQRQFEAALVQQLDQVTARLEFDAQGQPVIAAQSLSDPRWLKPYSGLYWQVDAMAPDGRGRAGVLRSRSLWDTSLTLRWMRWLTVPCICMKWQARRARRCWCWSAPCVPRAWMQHAGA